MLDVLRLVRAHNLVVAAAGVLAGGWIARGALAMPKLLVFAAVAAVGFGAAGNAWNDIWDAVGDRVNRGHAERPLAAGRLGRGTADLCVVGGSLLGFGAAALVSGTALLVGLAALAVMSVYSPVLKRRGFAGNVAVALIAGLPLFYGALALGRPEAGLVPWVLAAWLHLVREIVKDLDDIPGDRLLGRRTLPLLLGSHRAALVAAALAVAFVPASLVLPWMADYGGPYYVVALFAQLTVLLVASRLITGRGSRNSLLLKGAMIMGIVALVAGRVA